MSSGDCSAVLHQNYSMLALGPPRLGALHVMTAQVEIKGAIESTWNCIGSNMCQQLKES